MLQKRPSSLVGNRLVLTGAVMYLLEWVAIIGAKVDPPFAFDTPAAKVVAGYQGNAAAFGWAASFWSVVLLGRVLIVIGIRKGLFDSGRANALVDLAVAAMAIGVTLEIVTYGVVAAAAAVNARSRSAETVRALDIMANTINGLLFGPTGVAVLIAGYAMYRARLFPRVLCWLGILSGFLLTVDGLFFGAPGLGSAREALQIGVPIFWVWMLWTGVMMWRARQTDGGLPNAVQP